MPDEPLGGVNLFCTDSRGDKMLPNMLSMRAHQEVKRACVQLAEAAKSSGTPVTPTKPVDTSASRNILNGISAETWAELREVAARVAMLKSKGEASGVMRKKDAMSLTEGPGWDIPFFVPIPLNDRTKMKLFINVDPAKVAQGVIETEGMGTSIEYRSGGTAINARAYVDTLSAQPSLGGFVSIQLDL